MPPAGGRVVVADDDGRHLGPGPESSMDETQLEKAVEELAEQLGVPGVAVGVLIDGDEHYAFHGITSVENPLSVDDKTLFQFGSTGKTFTATAMMRLVEQGKVELEAPVRRY